MRPTEALRRLHVLFQGRRAERLNPHPPGWAAFSSQKMPAIFRKIALPDTGPDR